MATLLPDPTLFAVDHLRCSPTEIVAVVRSTQSTSACPMCHHHAARIHSHYQRRLVDLPWHGVAMRLELQVRKWFCETLTCVRRIFTERFTDVVLPYARRTTHLNMWFTVVGLALGGEAGVRLLRTLGLRCSPDTLLQHIRALPVSPAPEVQAIWT